MTQTIAPTVGDAHDALISLHNTDHATIVLYANLDDSSWSVAVHEGGTHGLLGDVVDGWTVTFPADDPTAKQRATGEYERAVAAFDRYQSPTGVARALNAIRDTMDDEVMKTYCNERALAGLHTQAAELIPFAEAAEIAALAGRLRGDLLATGVIVPLHV